ASRTSSDFRRTRRNQTEHFGAAKYPSFGEAIGQLQTINQMRAYCIAASVRGVCGAKPDRQVPGGWNQGALAGSSGSPTALARRGKRPVQPDVGLVIGVGPGIEYGGQMLIHAAGSQPRLEHAHDHDAFGACEVLD